MKGKNDEKINLTCNSARLTLFLLLLLRLLLKLSLDINLAYGLVSAKNQ